MGELLLFPGTTRPIVTPAQETPPPPPPAPAARPACPPPPGPLVTRRKPAGKLRPLLIRRRQWWKLFGVQSVMHPLAPSLARLRVQILNLPLPREERVKLYNRLARLAEPQRQTPFLVFPYHNLRHVWLPDWLSDKPRAQLGSPPEGALQLDLPAAVQAIREIRNHRGRELRFIYGPGPWVPLANP